MKPISLSQSDFEHKLRGSALDVTSLEQDRRLEDLDLRKADLDGDGFISGVKEAAALFQILDAVDTDGIKGSLRLAGGMGGRAEAISSLVQPRSKVPQRLDAEHQTLTAQKLAERLGLTAMPQPIQEAAATLIKPQATEADRAQAQDKLAAWARTEAERLSKDREAILRTERHLASLIGWREADGTERPGYYDRIAAQARKNKDDKLLRWALREEAEARAMFRAFTARTAGDAALFAEAAKALTASAGLVEANGARFGAFAKLRAGYEADVKALAEGKLAPQLLDSKPWIEEWEATSKQLAATIARRDQLEARAKSDPAFAAWLKGSGLLEAIYYQAQALYEQREVIDQVIKTQQLKILEGRTGALFALRDQAVGSANAGLVALTKEDDPALEKRERELFALEKDLRAEVADLSARKTQLERTVAALEKKKDRTPEERFELKKAKLELQGALLDQNQKPITLQRQIAILEGAATAVAEARKTIDLRRKDTGALLESIGKAYGQPILIDRAGSNRNAIDNILRIDALASTPGLSREKSGILRLEIGEGKHKQIYRLGPDSSYADLRKFLTVFGAIHNQQQFKAYFVLREVLLKAGLNQADLESRGLGAIPKNPPADFLDARLPALLRLFENHLGSAGGKALIDWAQKPTDQIPGVTAGPAPTLEGAEHLVKYAKNQKQIGKHIDRDLLIAIVGDVEYAKEIVISNGADIGLAEDEARKLMAFARALLSGPLPKLLHAYDDGSIKVAHLEAYTEQHKAIMAHAATHKPVKGAPKADPKDAVELTFFPRAKEMVEHLNPTDYPWNWNSSNWFTRISSMSAGERAYALALFDATHSKPGESALSTILGRLPAGQAHASILLLTGPTAQEKRPEFEREYLQKPGGVADFIRHYAIGWEYLQKADARRGIDMPEALMHDYKTRLDRMTELEQKRTELQKNGDPKGELKYLERDLTRLGSELIVLAGALREARNAEAEHFDKVKKSFASSMKRLGIALAATAAAYFTAGWAAPKAGMAWAAFAATSVGTGAGMSAAFVMDAAQQWGEKGFFNVSLKQAGGAAIDAFPEAFSAALPTGILRAAMLTRVKPIFDGLKAAQSVRVLGVNVTALGANARLAGGVALYSGASAYVGNVVSAYYLMKRGRKGDLDAAEELLQRAPTDGLVNGLSAALLMPFSRFTGAAGAVSDGVTNMAQQIAYNKILGRAWDDDLLDSAMMGVVVGRVFETSRNVKAAVELNQRGAVGATVRLPGASPDVTWKIGAIDENRGFAVLESPGLPSRKVAAKVVLDANPQLAPAIPRPHAVPAGMPADPGWNRSSVLGVDPKTATITVDVQGSPTARPIAEVLKAQPELVAGMEANFNGQRYWVGRFDGKKFELIPQDPGVKVKDPFPKVTPQELFAANGRAIEAALSPPVVRVKEQTMVNGQLVWKDVHGYQALSVDTQNGTARLRNPKGEIEIRPLDEIAYEHSGIAFGALSISQHARYESRLLGLPDADLSSWASLRAKAADVSAEHAAMLDRAFAAGRDLASIRELYDASKGVPQETLGELFSTKGQTQHFKASCAAAACLFGLSVADPVFAKIIKDHPELGAWWQKEVLERNGGVANPRSDADYAHRFKDLGLDATGSKAIREGNGKNWYDTAEIHPSLTKVGLNDKAFWKGREAVIAWKGAREEVVRIFGDQRGNVFIESLPPSGKPRKLKLPAFEEVRVGKEVRLGIKVDGKVRVLTELGLPPEVKVPAKDRGMTAIHDAELMKLIELATGQTYLARDPTKFSGDKLVEAIDWSLQEGDPVPMSVRWHDPRSGAALDVAHQIWVAQRREVNGKVEYLVFDPHLAEAKWLDRSQLTHYTNLPGSVGKPLQVLLPDYIPLPGGAVHAGGTAVPGAIRAGGRVDDVMQRTTTSLTPAFIDDARARVANFTAKVRPEDLVDAPPFTNPANGALIPGGHWWEHIRNRHDARQLREGRERIARTLNEPDFRFTGINDNNRPVDIYVKEGTLVVTEAGNKSSIITAYGTGFLDRSTRAEVPVTSVEQLIRDPNFLEFHRFPRPGFSTGRPDVHRANIDAGKITVTEGYEDVTAEPRR